MKVGILTYHRSQNYGAQIQAYALVNYLLGQGLDVSVIDYWPAYHAQLYKPKFFSRERYRSLKWCGKIKYLAFVVLLHAIQLRRSFCTSRFAERLLNLSSSRVFDVVLYGSDQIWRKQHMPDCESYNMHYFADEFIQAKSKIAYAASMGKNEVESGDLELLKNALSRFDAISVRELDLQHFLEKSLTLSAQLVCDPVLLLSRQDWLRLVPEAHQKPYIFVYNLAGVPEITAISQRYSSETGLPTIEYCGYVTKLHLGKKVYSSKGALDFLQMVCGAEYVFTSSFHGVALSLSFGKQFFFATLPHLANRTESLLSKVGLSNRNISGLNPLEVDLSTRIDYSSVDPLLQDYRQSSQAWLNTQIENAITQININNGTTAFFRADCELQ